MQFVFVEFLVIALLALGITFVLFKYLESFAEGESKIMGGTIKYGGSLAGFAVVTYLLAYAHNTLTKTDADVDANDKSMDSHVAKINLDGTYDILLESPNFSETGIARIIHASGSNTFQISGQFDDRTFQEVAGVVNDNRRMFFTYENSLGEIGVAFGSILHDQPDTIFLAYHDASGFNFSRDSVGKFRLFRRQKDSGKAN